MDYSLGKAWWRQGVVREVIGDRATDGKARVGAIESDEDEERVVIEECGQ